jgi:signal peptidase I
MTTTEDQLDSMFRPSLLHTTLMTTVLAGLLTPLHITVVRGESMSPTLRPGGLYVLDVRYYRSHAVERGDIVVFRHEGVTYTKRVYGMPGDRLFLVRYPDHNGDDLVEPSKVEALRRLEESGRLPGRKLVELTVPRGQYFVMGDNEDVSWDSRSFGCIPQSAIAGRLMQ